MWWKNIYGKAIPLYIKEMKDDERQVRKDELGNFVNVFIRRAELEGKIGSVELEANENLPITWNQQKDTIMELIGLNNEYVNEGLFATENIPYLKRAVGLTEFNVPGEDDRQKEYEEIQQLINSEPIVIPPDPMMMEQAMMAGMPPPPPQEVPSVEPDYEADNHPLAADIDRRWLVGDAGRLCKVENPSGYKNVLLHMKLHKDMDTQKQMEEAQKQMMAQMGGMPPPPPPSGKGGKDNKEAPSPQQGPPINGDNSVQTIQ
jgi:hypothetical protein